jgi:hypothetical protein
MATIAPTRSTLDEDSGPVPARWALALVRRSKPFARVAASRAIVGRSRSRTDPTAGRFTHREVAGLIDHAFERFEREVPGLPGEPTVGSRQNVMLAALTLSLLEVLEESGVERAYAIELTRGHLLAFLPPLGPDHQDVHRSHLARPHAPAAPERQRLSDLPIRSSGIQI